MFETIPFVLAQADDGESPPVSPGPETTAVEGQDGAPQPDGQTQDTPAKGPFGDMWLVIMLIFLVMFIFMMGGQRKEKKKREAMLKTLNKGAKVQTVGGILGTVLEVRDNEIVLKVDESSNTRMRFSRSAVQIVLEEKAD